MTLKLHYFGMPVFFIYEAKKIVALWHILKTKKKKKNNKFKNSSKKDYNIIYTNNSLIYMPNK